MSVAGTIKKISPFWFLVVALACILWVPRLLALGMFMDGVYDSLLAENLYKGISTFWAPQTIYYTNPAYWDNPPLAMWTLGTCYKIFGDHYVVERIYSFVCALFQLGLIVVLWRTLFTDNKEIKTYAWLPCLLWLLSPLVGWCYSNNMLENTMSLFTTASITLALRYMNNQRQILISSAFIGTLLLLAVISKGPVALFPFAFPVLMIGYKQGFRIREAVVFTALQVIFFVILFYILFSLDAPKNFLHHYFDVQLKKALTHTGADVYNPGEIFIELLMALSVLLGLAVARFFWRRGFANDKSNNNTALRFILLGLCASAPIALSAKQSKFYLLPSITPFVIGFSAYLLPMAQWLADKLKGQKFSSCIKIGSGIAFGSCIFLCVYFKGEVVRDKDLLSDLKTASELLQNEPVVRADWSLFGEWSLRAYFLRLYGKKLCMPDEVAPAHYYITKPNQPGDKLPPDAPKIFAGKTFDLYKL